MSTAREHKNTILGDRCAFCPSCGWARRYLLTYSEPPPRARAPTAAPSWSSPAPRLRRAAGVVRAGRVPALRNGAPTGRGVRLADPPARRAGADACEILGEARPAEATGGAR